MCYGISATTAPTAPANGQPAFDKSDKPMNEEEFLFDDNLLFTILNEEILQGNNTTTALDGNCNNALGADCFADDVLAIPAAAPHEGTLPVSISSVALSGSNNNSSNNSTLFMNCIDQDTDETPINFFVDMPAPPVPAYFLFSSHPASAAVSAAPAPAPAPAPASDFCDDNINFSSDDDHRSKKRSATISKTVVTSQEEKLRRNLIAARQMRQRKKIYLDNLQADLEKYKTSTQSLQQACKELTVENAAMSNEIKILTAIVQQIRTDSNQ